MNFDDIVRERNVGRVRASLLNAVGSDMNEILGAFGLFRKKEALEEIDGSTAVDVLARILQKNLAYKADIMPERRARELAEQFISDFAGTRYYTNTWYRDSGSGVMSWTPLTESTFEAGIIALHGKTAAACVWIEDED